jgi:hypothetical protein
MQYLRVKNLERYQHYGTRNPPWIKLYRTILSDYELRQVPVISRLAFIYFMVLASETDNRVPYDCIFLGERMGFKVTESVVSPLIDSGFLLASGARRVLAIEEKCSSLPTLLLTASPSSDMKSNGHADRKRKLRSITDEDKPSERHHSFAQSLGIDPGPEWGKFKNYCLAHDKRYANFEAAFRNWLANAPDMKGRRV